MKMNKIRISLFLFLTATTFLFAQNAAVVNKQSFAPTAEENALLWEISGNNLNAPSYLFGTIHMIGKEDFFLTKGTKEAIEKTQEVTFEINMEDMTDLTSQFSLLMEAFMADGMTLKDLLDTADYHLVQAHFNKIGLPLFLFERMKPMFLTVLADLDMSPEAMSSGEIVSYEMKIMNIAKSENKEIGGLETAEYQMSMFDSIPYKAQAEMLVESIKSSANGDEEFEKMVELYKKQDLHGLYEMIEGEDEGISQYEELLLVNRNKNWIPVMARMMKKQPTFFAVGAGHLGGEKGVIALLRKEGYSVKPVKEIAP